ncbi:hypothetical protein J28TS4_04680 [Paenibacillus lautus]|nr:hypothetical protein J28TS4_04680 [Paenibacillus lautus]
MWLHEMEAIEKTAYGFVKITKEDLAKLGLVKKDGDEGNETDDKVRRVP